MMPPTMLLWSTQFLNYDFGADHPMAPLRLQLTWDLINALGLLPGVSVEDAPIAQAELLQLVHEPDYVAALAGGNFSGFCDDDTPVSQQAHLANAHIVGASVAGALAVWEGRARRAVNFAGGLHHAMPTRACGFCVYNDPAVAIAALLEAGAKRVAYLDIDAHHGDGVERAFWDDPRVLTISVHQHGHTLFPGTGFAQDIGGPRAIGMAANVALPPGTADGAWLRAIDATARPLLEEFSPEFLVSQHGCDTHGRDPLTGLNVSVDAQRVAASMVRDWAMRYCNGKWLALGGGGYEVHGTVPRVWAHLVGIAADRDVDPDTEIPHWWREKVAEITDEDVPETMSDGRKAVFTPWESGYDPSSEADRAILATRRSVFPEHGLDPYLD